MNKLFVLRLDSAVFTSTVLDYTNFRRLMKDYLEFLLCDCIVDTSRYYALPDYEIQLLHSVYLNGESLYKRNINDLTMTAARSGIDVSRFNVLLSELQDLRDYFQSVLTSFTTRASNNRGRFLIFDFMISENMFIINSFTTEFSDELHTTR